MVVGPHQADATVRLRYPTDNGSCPIVCQYPLINCRSSGRNVLANFGVHHNINSVNPATNSDATEDEDSSIMARDLVEEGNLFELNQRMSPSNYKVSISSQSIYNHVKSAQSILLNVLRTFVGGLPREVS